MTVVENRLKLSADTMTLQEAAMRADPTLVLFLVAMTTLAGVAFAEEWAVASPDGQLALTVRQAGGPGHRLDYSVSCGGVPVLEPSPLGIVRRDAAFDERLTLEAAGPASSHQESYTLVHGKRREVSDPYNERILKLRNATGAVFQVQLRAFNDGVAFRYLF